MSEIRNVPNGWITVATVGDNARIGDVFRCKHSIIEGRTGELFEIKSKSDYELVCFLDSYGDKFEKVAEGDGKKVKGY